ncbi:3-phosphoshikimate 1-carboxyvinyltransferase [Thermocladium modestius]|uniref:3-phosphoshikimate 1-carboxyvinyltransferase n=1 Tax=Thermocladium modestius TaxID=62609 RepID=A0A830GSN0_9CREN|nr:3-phosphoshikimate 1-carboxyvinyltransferase [Thermocladium modestius]GGP18906.1 3-phosphoshikimate 1-carboxyvinyltransferase [Thermocladium modestius]
MRVSVHPSRASGSVEAPPSKSWAIRFALIASMAAGESVIGNYPESGDALAALRLVGAMAFAERRGGSAVVRGPLRHGGGAVVDLGGSGSTLRMGLALASIRGGLVLDGDPTLRARPLKELIDALRSLGAEIEGDSLPVRVRGGLRGGRVRIRGDISSQFISSLMIAGAASEEGVEVEVAGPLVSRPYIHMTADALTAFGCRPTVEGDFIESPPCNPRPSRLDVPGDYALAAFYGGAAAASGGSVTVTRLPPPPPWRGDSVVVEHMGSMGVSSRITGAGWVVEGRPSGFVELRLDDAPDLAPVLAGVAAVGGGARLTGLGHLAFKESNRLVTVAEALRAFGAVVSSGADYLEVRPAPPRRGFVACGGDHRIAMLGGMLGAAWGADVDGAECVAKSNPSYWRDLASLGVGVWMHR